VDDSEEGASPGGTAKMPFLDPKTHYILTGSPEWRAATKAERRAVIEAFATNEHITSISMSDSAIDDDLARSWATVLASPTCVIQSLTLESNPISSAGIEALASALPSNSSLKELKMRNLLARVSKEAEEKFAESLEAHKTLTKLPIDFKSYKAKDDLQKWLERNEKARREAKGWGNAKENERTSVGHEPNWKPEINSAIKAPKIDAAHRGGRHVGMAREMWDGFFASDNSLKKDDDDETKGSSALFDSEALPQVDPEVLQASGSLHLGKGGASLPFVSLSDLTKSIQQKANELVGGISSWRKGSGDGGNDGRGGKKTVNLPVNPLAHAVADACAAHEEGMHEAVAKLEERKSKVEQEEAAHHEEHHRLAWLLETTGELAPPPAAAPALDA